MPTIRPTGTTPSYPEEARKYRLRSGSGDWAYGMGAAYLGRDGVLEPTLRRDVAVLQKAYDLGVRYFDTSAKYGDSELVVGAFVAGRPSLRDAIFLATKSPIPEELTPREAKRFVADSVNASLLRLQTDYIDLLQIHDIYSLSQVTGAEGAIEALQEARDAGKIRYIGLGTRPVALLEEAIVAGLVDEVLTYSDYTPIDQSAERLVRIGKAHGAGIVNGSPLSAGVLAGADPRTLQVPEWHEESVVRQRLAAEVYDLCAAHGIPVLAAALQYPLRNPDIVMNLTGPKDEAELEATLAALRLPIPASFWEELDAWNSRRTNPNAASH